MYIKEMLFKDSSGRKQLLEKLRSTSIYINTWKVKILIKY